jgi:integrase
MAKPPTRLRISKRTVDAAEPQGTRIEVWDSELRGFGLRIETTGTKTYIVRYRPKGLGREASKKTYKIGRHSELTPDEARGLAKQILGRVAAGEDPAAELREARDEFVRKKQGLTVEALGTLFMAEHVEPKRKAHTAASYETLFRRHIVPKLGKKLVADLRRPDIIKVHSDLSDKPQVANKVLAVLSSMFGFAAKRDLVPEGTNPARGIERFREEGRERYLTTEELGRLGEALLEAETIGLPWKVDPDLPVSKHMPKEWQTQRERVDRYAIAAIRLLLLTGARLREVLHLRWSYVDFERELLFLPDSKTGKKTIVLSKPAVLILEGLLPEASERKLGWQDQFVIRGALTDKPRADLKKPWDSIRQHAGLPDVRLHDLRHTFASIGAGSSLGLPIVGKLLGHSQPQTTARYAHLDANPLRRASDLIGDQIMRAMTGGVKAKP